MKLSRRRLFQGAGAGFLALPFSTALANTECSPASQSPLPVRVTQPRSIKSWELPTERTAIGIPDDYKPNLALLPDGRLTMVAVFEIDTPNHGVYFQTHSWESADGGRTWSERRRLPGVQGHEPFLTCTSKGTLFLTTTMLKADIHNSEGFDYMSLYRSSDYGRTWTRNDVILRDESRAGIPTKYGTMCSRNVVEMPDGRLLLGVSIVNSSVGHLWSSSNDGLNWQSSERVKMGKYRGKTFEDWDGFFDEDFTYRNSSGKFIHFVRCGPPSPFYPMLDGRVTPKRDDSGDRMMMCTSSDEGRTWSDFRDCGDYGVMYPRVIRLHDGPLLMTYTQRSLFYPIGLRAVLSHDDGETWDFSYDQITIEGETPWGMAQGGGFGNTVQLQDGGLVSCSSYRGCDNKFHVQVVRWRLDSES